MEVKELETALTMLPGVKYVCTGGNTAQQNLIQEIDKQCGRCSAISRTHCFFSSLFWDRKKPIRVCKPDVCMPCLQLGNVISLSKFQGTEVFSRAISLYWKDTEGFTEAAEKWAGLDPPEPRKQEGEEAWSWAPAHPGRGVHTMPCRKGGVINTWGQGRALWTIGTGSREEAGRDEPRPLSWLLTLPCSSAPGVWGSKVCGVERGAAAAELLSLQHGIEQLRVSSRIIHCQLWVFTPVLKRGWNVGLLWWDGRKWTGII